MSYPFPELHPADIARENAERLAKRVEVRIAKLQDGEFHELVGDYLCTADLAPVLLAFRRADYAKLGELIWDGVARQITQLEDR